MEITEKVEHQRLVVKQILESQFGKSRELDIFHKNIETQDKHFIEKLKERIAYRFSGGHSSVSYICNEEIDKLFGYVSEPEVKDGS